MLLSVPPNDNDSAARHTTESRRDLFGGALKCQIPRSWKDMSDIRPVPDHQEVFFHHFVSPEEEKEEDTKEEEEKRNQIEEYSADDSGSLIVIELLDRQDEISDEDAAQYFFDDLADVNGIDPSNPTERHIEKSRHWTKEDLRTKLMHSLSDEDDEISVCTCTGIQRVALRPNTIALVGYGGDFDQLREPRSRLCWTRLELCVVRLKRVQTDLLITLSLPWTGENIPHDANKNCDSESEEISEKTMPHHTLDFLKLLQSLSVEDWSIFS